MEKGELSILQDQVMLLWSGVSISISEVDLGHSRKKQKSELIF